MTKLLTYHVVAYTCSYNFIALILSYNYISYKHVHIYTLTSHACKYNAVHTACKQYIHMSTAFTHVYMYACKILSNYPIEHSL